MKTVTVRRTIAAPREQVFALLADHAGYTRFAGVRKAVLHRQGEGHRNGIGAVREIDAGRLWVMETITAYEPDRCFEYRISRSRPPLRHEGGRLSFGDVDGGTEVVWTSTFSLAVPLLNRLLDGYLARQLEKAFAGMLKTVALELEA